MLIDRVEFAFVVEILIQFFCVCIIPSKFWICTNRVAFSSFRVFSFCVILFWMRLKILLFLTNLKPIQLSVLWFYLYYRKCAVWLCHLACWRKAFAGYWLSVARLRSPSGFWRVTRKIDRLHYARFCKPFLYAMIHWKPRCLTTELSYFCHMYLPEEDREKPPFSKFNVHNFIQ